MGCRTVSGRVQCLGYLRVRRTFRRALEGQEQSLVIRGLGFVQF
jgi:hypothetical protein